VSAIAERIKDDLGYLKLQRAAEVFATTDGKTQHRGGARHQGGGGPGLAEQQDRDAIADEVQGRKILDQLPVDRRLEAEVELIERPSLGEPSESKTRRQTSVAGVRSFLGDDALQELEMGHVFRLGLLRASTPTATASVVNRVGACG
jgi:hypothetical protein